MPVLTADNFAEQMVAQLRVLDPSVSAEIGTPERKIIDSVAQSLADNQVDLSGLSSALDVDSKFGSNLDNFTSLLGFERQIAQAARGYVIFSRPSPAPANITIPLATTIQSNVVTTQGQFTQYATVTTGTIPAGEIDSTPVLMECVIPGTRGNTGAQTLTELVGVPIPVGVTSVTNPAPITGGANVETDNAYKVRFKNLVFRNLAGTEDQYLALAVSSAFTTKAVAIGPVSKYLEYIQIPDLDDAGYLNGAYSGGGNTGGVVGQWTTALSAIPYAQDIYRNPVPFVSNGETGLGQFFYRGDVDFIFNDPAQILGDASRESETAGGVAPNFTFLNVYNPVPGSGSPQPGLQATSPGDILLSEFEYLSAASRNSIVHNVTNAVDVFLDGTNSTHASCVFLPRALQFSASPGDALYMENYRRDGEPTTRPLPGNFFTPLFQSPLLELPDTITIDQHNYYLGVHYWLVHEVSLVGGSVRARDGIEWSNYLGGDPGGTVLTTSGQFDFPVDAFGNYDPTVPYNPLVSGIAETINVVSPQTNVSVEGYAYDANIPVLQGALEGAKQATTDPLAHRAFLRYFKVDATVMYGTSVNYALVNAAIGAALQAFFNNQFFGSVVQLSDLLDVIHQVPGVDNVRWTNDLPNAPNQMRVIETDINGLPLHTPQVIRTRSGAAFATETQRLLVPGAGVSGFGASDTFTLSWNDPTAMFASSPINLNSISASTIQSAIAAGAPGGGLYHDITVTADNYVFDPKAPLQSFTLTYATDGVVYAPSVTNLNVTQSFYAYDLDFFVHDNELPTLPSSALPGVDSVPGAIIRPRAQNTFTRPGIG